MTLVSESHSARLEHTNGIQADGKWQGRLGNSAYVLFSATRCTLTTPFMSSYATTASESESVQTACSIVLYKTWRM